MESKIQEGAIVRDQITYNQIPDNCHQIKEFIGGKFATCPYCNDTGTIDDDYGGHDCISCVSRLLNIPTPIGTIQIDWGDTVIKEDDGTFSIIKGNHDK